MPLWKWSVAAVAALLMVPMSVQAQDSIAAPVPPNETVVATPPAETAPALDVAPTPVPMPKEPTPAPAPKTKGKPDSLKPGQYIWESRAYDASDMLIVVVLDIQRIYVYNGDTLVAFSTLSSGKKGHTTPTGVFNILQKDADHRSNLYNNASMPYMLRLTWDGVALHAGHNPGYPASHGCIRLPLAFAKALYSVTKIGQKIVIVSSTANKVEAEPVPEPTPAPLPVAPEALLAPDSPTGI